jgi:hypothetical protein
VAIRFSSHARQEGVEKEVIELVGVEVALSYSSAW